MFSQQLPQALYTQQQTRELDKAACVALQLSEFELMQRAAAAALSVIATYWQQADSLLVVCGKGNNGGDGLVLAALAAKAHMQVDVLLLEEPKSLTKTAQQALQMAQLCGDAIHWLTRSQLGDAVKSCDLVVDAMFGIGMNGAPEEPYSGVIREVNAAEKAVFALDVPSGLCADSGNVFGEVVQATMTLCMVALKPGLVMHAGLQYCGRVLFAGLGITEDLYQRMTPIAQLNQHTLTSLPTRLAHSYKNNYGHVLIVGGDQGMGGAAILAAQAALRTGAGLVAFASRPEHQTAMLARCPDVMTHAVCSGQALEPLLPHADVIVVGPGMKPSAWSEQLLFACLRTNKPLVVDAGALTLLGQHTNIEKRENWILLPHPGEALRLLAAQTGEVQQRRIASAANLQQRWGGVAVLKGAGTLITAADQTVLSARANPALATAGMGDVLSGIAGALVAQGLSLFDAAALAVNLHLDAAQRCTQQLAAESVTASDLVDQIACVLKR